MAVRVPERFPGRLLLRRTFSPRCQRHSPAFADDVV
ncbi:MAG: hypothetical protein ACI9MX_003868, partial [Candidatus Aldehydirespiratoraceae bacterium]